MVARRGAGLLRLHRRQRLADLPQALGHLPKTFRYLSHSPETPIFFKVARILRILPLGSGTCLPVVPIARLLPPGYNGTEHNSDTTLWYLHGEERGDYYGDGVDC